MAICRAAASLRDMLVFNHAFDIWSRPPAMDKQGRCSQTAVFSHCQFAVSALLAHGVLESCCPRYRRLLLFHSIAIGGYRACVSVSCDAVVVDDHGAEAHPLTHLRPLISTLSS